jgi:hypothetical protein
MKQWQQCCAQEIKENMDKHWEISSDTSKQAHKPLVAKGNAVWLQLQST